MDNMPALYLSNAKLHVLVVQDTSPLHTLYFGTLNNINGNAVTLNNASRIVSYYESLTYEKLAANGLKPYDYNKITEPEKLIQINNTHSVYALTNKAYKSLKNSKIYEPYQNYLD